MLAMEPGEHHKLPCRTSLDNAQRSPYHQPSTEQSTDPILALHCPCSRYVAPITVAFLIERREGAVPRSLQGKPSGPANKHCAEEQRASLNSMEPYFQLTANDHVVETKPFSRIKKIILTHSRSWTPRSYSVPILSFLTLTLSALRISRMNNTTLSCTPSKAQSKLWGKR